MIRSNQNKNPQTSTSKNTNHRTNHIRSPTNHPTNNPHNSLITSNTNKSLYKLYTPPPKHHTTKSKHTHIYIYRNAYTLLTLIPQIINRYRRHRTRKPATKSTSTSSPQILRTDPATNKPMKPNTIATNDGDRDPTLEVGLGAGASAAKEVTTRAATKTKIAII